MKPPQNQLGRNITIVGASLSLIGALVMWATGDWELWGPAFPWVVMFWIGVIVLLFGSIKWRRAARA